MKKLFNKVLMSSYFIISIVSILSAMLVVGMRVCFASKCKEVDICWGLFSVKRSVALEDTEFPINGMNTTTSLSTQKQSVLAMVEEGKLGSVE